MNTLRPKISFSPRRSRAGFTFLELLVVVVLMGVMASIVVVSYTSTSLRTRDARRKRDAAALQAALQIYKERNGAYPEHTDCSAQATWPGCTDPWIEGMTIEYISRLPQDPKENYYGFVANQVSGNYTYNYVRNSATSYHIIVKLEKTDDPDVNGSDYGYSGTGIYVLTEPR